MRRRKEVYWSSYRGGQRVAGPEVCQPARLGEPTPESDYRLDRVDVMRCAGKTSADVACGAAGNHSSFGCAAPADLVAVADFTGKPESIDNRAVFTAPRCERTHQKKRRHQR